ncbi:MAG: hypothetical protein IPG56_09770 [Caulobacteraceae bacterium]|nr:hypothetical protein [Caulobacteraceae bacterium]
MSVNWNQQWVDGNLYSSVADVMVMFRQSGAVRYGWGNETDAGAMATVIARAGADLPNLRRLARSPTPADTVAHTYARFGDRLLVIAVVPITREDNAARIAHNPLRGYDYLAVVKVIDAAGFVQLAAPCRSKTFISWRRMWRARAKQSLCL